MLKTHLLKRILSSVLLAFMLLGQISTPVGALTSEFFNGQSDSKEGEIVLDSQFLEFYEIGETKNLNAKLNSGDGEIKYTSSNSDIAKVDENGNVTWISGTEPVIITASLKSNPEIKVQAFVSFEGDDVGNDALVVPIEDIDELGVENDAFVVPANDSNKWVQLDTSRLDLFSQVNPLASALSLTITPGISMGESFTVALKADGTVWTWGSNAYGQLGIGGTNTTPSPTKVNISNIVKIDAGGNHVLALDKDGIVWSWGYNNKGQLGDATVVNKEYPQKVKGGATGNEFLQDIIEISAGSQHSMAVNKDGYVYIWGYNQYGTIGDGTVVDKTTPVQTKGEGNTGVLSGIISVAAGTYHSMALGSNGYVYIWGHNGQGELAQNTTADANTPLKAKSVSGTDILKDIVSIANSERSSMAVDKDGNVYAWGHNYGGVLGDGTTTQRNLPVQVKINATEYLTNIKEVSLSTIYNSAASSFAFALSKDGKVYAWGYNGNGQLGDTTTTNRSYAKEVRNSNNTDDFKNAVSIAVSQTGNSAGIVKSDGFVYTLGLNTSGQLGNRRLYR